MPRINIDDELRADPRFHALCELVPRHEAFGSLICLWDLGQAHWKRKASLIPISVAEQTPNYAELVRTGFAEVRADGIYCTGAERLWNFLIKRSEAGKKSAASRREKNGTAVPVGAINHPNRAEHHSGDFEHTEPSSSSSSSSSGSASSSKRKRERVNSSTASTLPRLAVLWNNHCGDKLSKVEKTNSARNRKSEARYQEHSDLEWVGIIERIVNSEFCRGANDRGWKATYNWLIQADTALKVLEGLYDNRVNPSGAEVDLSGIRFEEGA